MRPLPPTVRLRWGAPGKSTHTRGPWPKRPSSKKAWRLVPGGVRSSNTPSGVMRQAARALAAQAGKAASTAKPVLKGSAAASSKPGSRARRRWDRRSFTAQNRAGRRC